MSRLPGVYMNAQQLLAMHASTKILNLPAHTVHAEIGNSQRLNSHMEWHAMNNVGTCTSTLWKEGSSVPKKQLLQNPTCLADIDS